jgi:hypothetical protein
METVMSIIFAIGFSALFLYLDHRRDQLKKQLEAEKLLIMLLRAMDYEEGFRNGFCASSNIDNGSFDHYPRVTMLFEKFEEYLAQNFMNRKINDFGDLLFASTRLGITFWADTPVCYSTTPESDRNVKDYFPCKACSRSDSCKSKKRTELEASDFPQNKVDYNHVGYSEEAQKKEDKGIRKFNAAFSQIDRNLY